MERQKKKEQIRETIIQAIFLLLEEKSWESMSSNEICEKAGISKRTLYAYFHRQDELYLELVKRSFETMNEAMSSAMTFENTAEDTIIELGLAYIRFMLENPVQEALIIGFDEKKFFAVYEKQVNEIQMIANEFELMHLFRKLKLDPEKFDANLAIFLWTHIQGVTQLIHSKGKWLENYYDASIQSIIQAQMKLARKCMEE